MQKLGKLFGIFLLALVLTLNFSPLSFAATNTDGNGDGQVSVTDSSAEVTWSLQGCWVAIEAHEDVNLATDFILTPGATIDSTDVGGGQKRVHTESTCPGGYTVSVTANSFPQNPAVDGPNSAIEDFDVNLSNYSSNSTVSSLLSGWGGFNDIGDSIDVGTVDSSDFRGNMNNINGSWWEMNYRYNLDGDDRAGDYRVELDYTVTSN